jgi:hypothetical protein
MGEKIIFYLKFGIFNSLMFKKVRTLRTFFMICVQLDTLKLTKSIISTFICDKRHTHYWRLF